LRAILGDIVVLLTIVDLLFIPLRRPILRSSLTRESKISAFNTKKNIFLLDLKPSNKRDGEGSDA
jgi:hypothetical protein